MRRSAQFETPLNWTFGTMDRKVGAQSQQLSACRNGIESGRKEHLIRPGRCVPRRSLFSKAVRHDAATSCELINNSLVQGDVLSC